MDVLSVYGGICHLGECPVWNVQQQKLYWTDIYNKQIWVYDPALNVSSLFWQGKLQVGGFAFTRNGGIVLCTDKGIYLLPSDTGDIINAQPILLFDFQFSEGEMFNDITVDPQGRIFAGTISRVDFATGILYRIEKGKSPVAVQKNLRCSNGMTFSLDEKYFFHTDSDFGTITKYEYKRSTGEISNPTIYFHSTPKMGVPDGITLDSEGHIWVAFWGGSCVRRLDFKGNIVDEIKLPAKQPSSLMFGGANLNELYITSASESADNICTGYCDNGVFLGGQVYKYYPGITGRAEWLADF